jgi:hypothetical protein
MVPLLRHFAGHHRPGHIAERGLDGFQRIQQKTGKGWSAQIAMK